MVLWFVFFNFCCCLFFSLFFAVAGFLQYVKYFLELLLTFALLLFLFSPLVPPCPLVCLVCSTHRSAPSFGLAWVYVFAGFAFNWPALFSVSSVHQVTFLCFVFYELFCSTVCMYLFLFLGLMLHLPVVWGSSFVSCFAFCFCVFLLIPF